MLSKENFTGRAIMAILSIPREDVQQVLEEAHAPGHIGGAKIYDHLMTLGYYWLTLLFLRRGYLSSNRLRKVGILS